MKRTIWSHIRGSVLCWWDRWHCPLTSVRMSAIVRKLDTEDGESVDLSDAVCPICLAIYVEPVR